MSFQSQQLGLTQCAKDDKGTAMKSRIILTLMVVATLAGCARVSESRLNPLNWFGRSESTNVVTTAAAVDGRQLVAQVTTLRVEPVPGGAIVRATGLPTNQGFFDGSLVTVPATQAGVLNFEFRISPPREQTRVSTVQSREVIVGRFVSEQTLAGIRTLRVSGSANALAVRR